MTGLSNLSKGILCTFGSFLLLFSSGTVYTFGNMSPYIASYLKYRTNTTSVTNGDTVWIFSMTIISKAITMPLGGFLERFIGVRPTCLIGGLIMSVGTTLTFISIKVHIWLVVFTYGFLYGSGVGLIYSVALAASVKWFPFQSGLISGIVVTGYGLGALLLNLVQTTYINPLNISPNVSIFTDKYFTDSSVLDNIPSYFILSGVMFALIQLIGVSLLITDNNKKSSDEEHYLIEEDGAKNIEYTTPSFTVREAMTECRFYMLWINFFLNGVFIVTISSLYKNFGQTFINDDRFFSIIGAIAAIFNAGGRMVWGKLFDIFKYKKVMTILTFSMALGSVTFYFTCLIQSVIGAKIMYSLWVFTLFFSLSGSFSVIPAATCHHFGTKNLAILYGIIYSGYAISSLLGALLCSILLHIILYWGQFILVTLFALFSMILTQFFQDLTN